MTPSFSIFSVTAVCVWLAIRIISKYRVFLTPLLQQLLYYRQSDQRTDPRVISKARTRADGPVYLTYDGWKPIVVLAGSDVCADFYSKVKTVIRKRALDLGDLFDRFIGDCLGALTGKRWQVVKRAFQSAMLKMQSEHSISIMHNEITRWQRKVLDPLAQSRCTVDALELVADMPQRVTQAIFFGEQFVDQHEATLRRLAALSKKIITDVFFNRLAKMWFYRFLPTETNKALEVFKTELADLLKQYDMQDEKTQQQGVLFWVRRDKITREELLQTLAEILFVNLDVSVPSTAWLLVHLALHPEKIDIGYASTFSEDVDENVDPEVLNFVKESARFAPIGYLSTQQLSDREIFGYPAGTSFAVDVVSLNRDPTIWSYPDVFDPARFEDENENQDSGFMRFGMGTRKCPGRHLTDILFSAILTRIARRYDLQLVSEVMKSSDDVPLHDSPFLAPQCQISVAWKPILAGCDSFGQSAIFSGVSITPTSPFRDQRKANALFASLARARQPVTVILPDTLNRYNVMAFEGKSEKKAIKISQQRGEELYNNLHEAWVSLPDDEARKRIHLWRMRDVEADPVYHHQLAIFRKHYDQDSSFRATLNAVADRYIKHRGRAFAETEPRFRYVAEYIIGELPILVCGVKQSATGVHCTQLVYSAPLNHLEHFEQPRPDSLFTLANRLKEGKEFENLREQLGQTADPGQVLLPM